MKERWDFQKDELNEGDLLQDPIALFQKWYEHAVERNVQEPNAMVLATVKDGRPSTRVVYLRDVLEEGLVFYTNYKSHKGQSISENPQVALNFHWSELERQVKVRGVAVAVPHEVSDQYFAGRPRISQLGAWASEQSSEIDDRTVLEARLAQFEKEFEGVDVPRPPHWGGYVVEPQMIEFWQGRPGRLHDRFKFTRMDGNWVVTRLSP